MQLEEINPELVCEISDRKLGVLGYLVIDSSIDGVSGGGVRVASDLTLEELIHLARNMTFKYGFLGFRTGGAKAGIFIDPSCPKEVRIAKLKAFGKGIAPLIRAGVYRPGSDMGANADDLLNIYEGAGLEKKYGELNSEPHVYTSWTMVVSARELLREIGISLAGLSVAIQGFGKVGEEVAKVFSKEGAKVVAVSNKRGAIYNPTGIDVQKLLETKCSVP